MHENIFVKNVFLGFACIIMYFKILKKLSNPIYFTML